MKLRKGNAVEVLKRKEQCESWFPATVISADRYKCTVSYDFFLKAEGDHIVEEVCNDNVRPYPPTGTGEERWTVGDIVEVFDLHCWRVGKVVKGLNNARFVIRLSGSIQLKEFRRCDLRARQAWQNNKWTVIEKVRQQIIDNVKLNTKFSQSCNGMPPEQGVHKKEGSGENAGQRNLQMISPVRNLKRKHGCNFILSQEDEATGRGTKERKTSAKVGRYDLLPAGTSLRRQVDEVSFPKKNLGKKCMIKSTTGIETNKTNDLHPYSMPVRATEESTECSVASCSGNGPLDYTSQHFRKSRDISCSAFDVAESLCASDSGPKFLPTYDKVEIEDDVHKLELHAYRLTMQALYASGPLSWEQESLLTNLRLSLHISNEEHLLHLKQLLSAQVL